MPLSWNEIRHRAIASSKEWMGATREQADKQIFWNVFFKVFGVPLRAVASFEESVKNLSGDYGYIDLFWPGKVLVEHKSRGKNFSKAESQAFRYIQDLARAGSTDARYGPLDDIAWYDKNSGGKAHEVGQKRPNAFNLLDMLGNVWERVSDGYGEKYYEGSPERDPPGATSSQHRVARGGMWYVGPRGVTVTNRYSGMPDDRDDGIGVRCVGELDLP